MDGTPLVRDDAGKGVCQALETYDITVLMGGPSCERCVSLMSGNAIADALEELGHRVVRADITPQDVSALDREGIDLVFIALHGDFGESGQVQALCEDRGLRYTGSGERASSIGMDKAATKQVLKRAGLQTPDWMIIEEYHAPEVCRTWLEELGLPVVLKPVDGGSSLDVTIARTEKERAEALEELLDKYSRAMLERFVPGREFTVSVLGDVPLPVLEIISERDFYDYDAKYSDGMGTRYEFEHGLDDETVAQMQADALAAHKAIGCRDMSRVDFILPACGRAEVLEINTIPGFTSHSLLPKAAQQMGIGFTDLVGRIVEMAMTREP